ncbi:MAG TPA: N-6 DNA methylase, partial [Candidatus Syntrophosphaera sp.]|nr:N-6 DNA methylase [Candidatus Syntrophosphaera sp.]
AFQMLVPMRMSQYGLSARDAVEAVLRDNIHGLELDNRCVELAAFALAMTAWKYPEAGGYRVLPEMNVACCGLAVGAAKEEWRELGAGNHNLRVAMETMHDAFRDAPILGSLFDPSDPAQTDATKILEWDELKSALDAALRREQTNEQMEVAVVAQGLAQAAVLLTSKYHLVVTNVPYLARGKQNERLRDFCEKHYPAAKNDLATVFLNRCLELCVEDGTSSVVLPQNWLFLTGYKRFREKLLKNDTWHLIARLGEGGFDSTAAAGAFVAMISLSRGNSTRESGGLFGYAGGASLIRGVDVSGSRTATEKAAQLVTAEIKSVEQTKQLENPDAAIIFEARERCALLGENCNCNQGIGTADISRFVLRFWELPTISDVWDYYFMAPNGVLEFNGYHSVLRWEQGTGVLANSKSARVCGQPAWGKKGVGVAVTRGLSLSAYRGERFDCTVAVITPKDEKDLAAMTAFLRDEGFDGLVRSVDQALSVTESSFLKVPFNLGYWNKVAGEEYPNGLPKPHTDEFTQWLFHGHPCGSVVWDDDQKWTAHGLLRTDDTVLHVAVARLLGYRWPAELDPNMELAAEQREWVIRCEALFSFADRDGIVCIPPVRGEASASDRLLNLLAAAYGDAWSNDRLAALLTSADHAGKTLETWLRDKFFIQHCKLFQHRPFIWHIWDGLRDGFSALVNYHKLDRKLLENLIYTYLGDWISRQKQDIARGVDGAQERLAAAEVLKKKLELILRGEVPYDIFVRWKPLNEQPIGWNPDLNDGVRLNIRPFVTAGVLRETKPPRLNIRWEKDRGKDVESAPWYHAFKGDRINDHHLTLAEKRSAQEAEK